VRYFDYEVLGYCEAGVPAPRTPEGVVDCQENAMYRIWWMGKEIDSMLLCPEHFKSFSEAEEREIKRRREK